MELVLKSKLQLLTIIQLFPVLHYYYYYYYYYCHNHHLLLLLLLLRVMSQLFLVFYNSFIHIHIYIYIYIYNQIYGSYLNFLSSYLNNIPKFWWILVLGHI